VHATHTLHPRVLAHSSQHSATEAEEVAPGPDPGTITTPSYSVLALPWHCWLEEAVAVAAAATVAVAVAAVVVVEVGMGDGGGGGGGGGGGEGGGGGGGEGGGGGGVAGSMISASSRCHE